MRVPDPSFSKYKSLSSISSCIILPFKSVLPLPNIVFLELKSPHAIAFLSVNRKLYLFLLIFPQGLYMLTKLECLLLIKNCI